ncbi:Holliday junction DNA helicase RuvB [Anaplasma marginale str. Dawn]|uniref:Holliday junction branch migration complex subunit RuvB n=3 Tax=Anaplasma TaxID=768 RepID=RUVB_ANAMF|nr:MULTISPECIES: Holliday junction branch migration DNA helicase RuvB [Anaplasma]B9KHQ5.1 RecName: Full=Holliday junction branch migration complex subunit RuvB [Anaplasma marginale str. Florida]ACM49017.1 Holliday junction DNA helicase (ruvB) [Anaplasma marginale str. Florida]ACZ49573.1 Holliday junction DNA helicase B [Anaplasma centrale str. Israel]AGZ78589.1 Holliday junction DNA helicase RuvB [Anaplasma marginale str. Gypsy Plains]AGZ79440.1 Holliday junction DNA helicase RuvB [Anaplasma m
MSNDTLHKYEALPEDHRNVALRPCLIEEFVGQTEVIKNLKVFIQSAYERREPMDHVLLYGPPGLGKTTLAHIIAKELKVNFRSTAGPLLSKAGDLAAILTNLQPMDVLFIDEIHRLNRNIEEVLYSAMEDYCLDIVVGEGCGARTLKIDIPAFTLIGATTRFGLISNPLRDRFGIPLHLEFYSVDELVLVIKRAAGVICTSIDDSGAREIASRSRGTPRIALRLFRRVRDFLEFERKHGTIDGNFANSALFRLGIDGAGFDKMDLKYLKFVFEAKGPVGIDTIASALSEDVGNIEETIEPYLIKTCFIQRTPRGRVLTQKGFEYLLSSKYI